MFKPWIRFLLVIILILTLKLIDDFLTRHRQLTRQPGAGQSLKKTKLGPQKASRPADLTQAEKRCLELTSGMKVDMTWVCSREALEFDSDWVQDRFSSEEKSRMSNTGRRIFLEENVPPRKETRNRDLVILVWNQNEARFNRRFLYSYSDKYTYPWGPQCSVHNCRVTHNSSEYDIVGGGVY